MAGMRKEDITTRDECPSLEISELINLVNEAAASGSTEEVVLGGFSTCGLHRWQRVTEATEQARLLLRRNAGLVLISHRIPDTTTGFRAAALRRNAMPSPTTTIAGKTYWVEVEIVDGKRKTVLAPAPGWSK